VLTDGELTPEDLCVEVAAMLRDAGPWGQGFPEPEFEGKFSVESWKVVGEKHLKLKLRHPDLAEPLDGIAFGAYSGERPPSRLRAVFALDVNEWNGRQTLQLLIRLMTPA
jgi:single-stranded-DNA-specific exonuclease